MVSFTQQLLYPQARAPSTLGGTLKSMEFMKKLIFWPMAMTLALAIKIE
jgi:hypothetical protein